MITKLDKVVIRYLVVLAQPRPRGEAAICHYMDKIDVARYRVLDLLIRKPRYRGVRSRDAWKSRNNPHRPASE